jgi:S-adenosylmethionine:tRNA ribosyltransferase-isomerase
MIKIPVINLRDFDYPLPPERIAQFPLVNRDASKLLICTDKTITEDIFSNIEHYIPPQSLLVFNDTKVFRARLIFSKETGATIEIFCLEPYFPTSEITTAFAQTTNCTWKCLVGNVKRWKGELLKKEFIHMGKSYVLFALNKENLGDGCFAVEFHWEPANISFLELLQLTGFVPLPPYITRAAGDLDALRYQTIYAQNEGSVAAPTAGFHFTNHILNKLKQKGCHFENITLHIGVGTFRPVSAQDISGHIMHSERIYVQKSTINSFMEQVGKTMIAVGTTSVRTLESLYWSGVRLLIDGVDHHPQVQQWDPYQKRYDQGIPVQKALTALVEYLDSKNLAAYSGTTQLMILPGYKFRFTDGIITNFHLPQSTLLMLVSAFIGEKWRVAYEFAYQHDFRFLSYGDACLFFTSGKKITE